MISLMSYFRAELPNESLRVTHVTFWTHDQWPIWPVTSIDDPLYPWLLYNYDLSQILMVHLTVDPFDRWPIWLLTHLTDDPFVDRWPIWPLIHLTSDPFDHLPIWSMTHSWPISSIDDPFDPWPGDFLPSLFLVDNIHTLTAERETVLHDFI